MKRWIWIAALLGVAACTEENPAYDPRDAGRDDATPADEGGDVAPDVDADPPDGADADAPDVAPDVPDGDAPDVDPEDGEAETDVADIIDVPDVADETSPDDRDGDGIPNGGDNCPDVWNPGQEDCDGNGIGDRCQAGDTDRDTLPDAIDVCPCRPGTLTHDEDGDTLVDDCDNCPLVWNPDQANVDLDGLGDTCEPPSDPGSLMRIDLFEPFLGVPTVPGWFEAAGTWAATADRYDQLDDLASATAFFDPWERGSDLFAQGTFRITGVPAGTLTKRAGILARAVRLHSGGVRWYACVIEETTDMLEIRKWDGAGYATLRATPAGVAVQVGPTEYRLSFLVRGSSLTCALEAPGSAPVILTTTDGDNPVGAAGVRAMRMIASFGGLMVARPE